MKTVRIKFQGSLGHHLVGNLDSPENPVAYALFAHCFTCSKNLKSIYKISQTLVENNIAVFRFDFTGLGESHGDFSQTNLSTNIQDLVAASDFLTRNYAVPQILIGHSLGGSAIIQSAQKITKTRAVILIATPYRPISLQNEFDGIDEKLKQHGQADIVVGGMKFQIQKEFFENLKVMSEAQRIDQLGKPLLIIHPVNDNIVPIRDGIKLLNEAKYPKNFISLEKSDHLLSNFEDSEYVGHLISIWANQYLIN